MLLYEAGYLCNTSANTKYGVSEKFLLNTLHRGKIIHGVRLGSNGELQVYNFRKLNKVRLEAFSNVRFEVDEIDELLQEMRGSIGDSFELCLYARGITLFRDYYGFYRVYKYYEFVASFSGKSDLFSRCFSE